MNYHIATSFFIDIRNLTVNYRNLTFYVHSLLLYSNNIVVVRQHEWVWETRPTLYIFHTYTTTLTLY